MDLSLGEAVRIGARVTTFEMHLVRPHGIELQKELPVEIESARGCDVQLRDPATDPVGIELLIPGAVERVRQVHATTITADLHHLRCAVQRSVRTCWMRLSLRDATQPYRSGLDRIERIRHVELLQLAGAPARDVQESVV